MGKIVKMKRVNYHLTLKQIEKLKKLSAKEKIPVAKIIRLAIDRYLESMKLVSLSNPVGGLGKTLKLNNAKSGEKRELWEQKGY